MLQANHQISVHTTDTQIKTVTDCFAAPPVLLPWRYNSSYIFGINLLLGYV